MKAFQRMNLVGGLAAALAYCLCAAPSMGATMFSESFDGADGTTSFGPNFTLPGSPGNYQIQSNQAANPGVDFSLNDATRRYVVTNDSDYGTVDFIAEITMIRTGATPDVYGEGSYFGIGEGVPDSGAYGAPNGSLFIEMFPTWGPTTRFEGNLPGPGGSNVGGDFPGDMPAATTSRLRMTKTGSNLQFAIDVGSSTFVTADISSSVIDLAALAGAPLYLDLNSLPSHIFFGGGSNVVWDDFVVMPVPEPSSLALLLCGSVLIPALRRKRRA